ncbi:MAG: glucose/arabinose dehydrogenase [Planctomycetaceae bacterium]|jgi:glucose/arabinose dehydrogenase
MRLAELARLTLVVGVLSLTPLRGDAGQNELTEAESRSGWKLLFDGETTEGWRNYKKDSVGDGWKIEDGVLSRVGKGAGDIITTGQFEHFELQLEYRISKGGNSGLMFHVTEENARPWHSGPEIQIQDNVDGHDPQKAGWLYQLYQPQKPGWAKKFEAQVGYKGIEMDDATRPAGQWNQLYFRVTARDGEVCMNGVSYFKFVKGSDDWNKRVAASKFAKMANFGKATKGHICLQDHGNLVSFRNIRVRELPESGAAPEPIDGTLKLKPEVAFPNIAWEDWSAFNENGKPNPPKRPLHVTHAGDGTNRVFVIDQSGLIHVLPNDPATKKATVYADIRERTHQFSKDDEEGVLGFAFHPNYKSNGQFFVYYNTESGDRKIYLSRFTVSKDDPNKADEGSEEILMTIQQPFANHNGGPMAFGPDGYLYIGMGDGGGRNDPEYTAQAKSSFLGCVLRIDVDHKSDGKNYAIPKDNPFVGQKNVPGEIYAYGIRNPWRVSFDSKTGSFWLADVGQDLWEEVNIIKKGGNYGWSAREGSFAFGNHEGSNDITGIAPVWEYDHRIGKSITGGHVYRGSKLPELAGHYLYGDYVAGKVWALHYDEDAGKVIRNVAIPWNGLNVLAFGEDEQGEAFVTTPNRNGKGIYRLVQE